MLGTHTKRFAYNGRQYEACITDNGSLWTASVYDVESDFIGESLANAA